MNRQIVKSICVCLIIVSSVYFVYASKYSYQSIIHSKSSYPRQFITDKLGLASIRVNKIITPDSVKELQNTVRITTLPISVAGATYSQGGQTGYPDGMVIDMKNLTT